MTGASVDALIRAIYGHVTLAGRLELGAHVATRIRLVCGHLPPWHPARGRYLEVADGIQTYAAPNESARDISRAERGFVDQQPLLATLIARHESDTGLPGDPLRAFILLRVWAEQLIEPINVVEWIRDLHAFLKRWDQSNSSDFTGHEQLSALLQSPGDGALQAARLGLSQALERFKASQAARRVGRVILDQIAFNLIDDQEYAEREAAGERLTAYLSNPVVEGGPRELSVSEDRRILLSDPDDREVRTVVLRRETERSGWLVARALIPNSDKALDIAESRDAVAFLTARTAAETVPESVDALAALVFLLTLVTSHGHKDLLRSLRTIREGKLLQLVEERWYVERSIPNGEEHAQANHQRGSESYCYLLPLPREIWPALHAIRRAPDQFPTWIRFEEAEKRLLIELQKAVTPRYSEVRARFAIPSTVFGTTEDPARAQFLVGDKLGQSDAPLAYYGEWLHETTKAWQARQLEVLGLEVSLNDARPDRWVGAPLADIADQRIRSLVHGYVTQVEAALKSGDAVLIHDALVVYLCRRFVALTGHRGIDVIGDTLLADMLLAGAASFMDKPGPNSPGNRVAVVGRDFIQDVQSLIRLRNHIARESGPYQESAAAHCALEGRLFWLVSDRRQIEPRDIKPPIETGLPVNVYRSRLRMQLTRRGVWPRVIYSQLGHEWNGEHPYGAHTTESLCGAIEYLAPVLESVLKDDGWKRFVIPPRLLPSHRAAPWPIPRLHKSFGREEAWALAEVEVPQTSRRRFPVEQKLKHVQWVLAGLKRIYVRYPVELAGATEGSIPKDVVLSSADIDDLTNHLTLAAQGKADRIAVCLRMARARVIWNRRSFGWTGLLPSLAIETGRPTAAITRTHIAASNLIASIRECIVSLDSFAKSDRIHARWNRLAALLILDHAVYLESQRATSSARRSAWN